MILAIINYKKCILGGLALPKGKNESEGKKERFYKKSENWVIFIGVLAIILAICVPFIILFKLGWIFTYQQFEKLGVVGDFFGGTTVGLFTLASIIFVIAAIVMQKKELELQRRELTLTREEFKTGNDTAKIQQIDNAFYNMLSLHHQIVNNIVINHYGKILSTGRQSFEELKSDFINKIGLKFFLSDDPDRSLKDWSHFQKNEYKEKIFGNFDTINQDLLDEVYYDFHEEFGNGIGHYMRNNYRIVKFIVNNVADNITEQQIIKEQTGREPIIGDKRYYFGMLRAQWSNAEFELILINSLFSDNIKFKKLILEYDVLDILEPSSIGNIPKLKNNIYFFNAYRKLIEVKV